MNSNPSNSNEEKNLIPIGENITGLNEVKPVQYDLKVSIPMLIPLTNYFLSKTGCNVQWIASFEKNRSYGLECGLSADDS